MKTVLRSDRRKNPETVEYEYLTFDECRALAHESHCHILDQQGKIAQVKITSVKTWKTRPNELLIGWKYGLYEYGKESIVGNDPEARGNAFFVRIVPSELENIARDVVQRELDSEPFDIENPYAYLD